MMAHSPPKFRNLNDLSTSFPVPASLCLDQNTLIALLPGLRAAGAGVADIAERILRTSGSQLGSDLVELDVALGRISGDTGSQARLTALLAPVFGEGWAQDSFAVRSAAHVEDSRGHSFAGVFESVLDVSGPQALLAAIGQVWRSGFSQRSVVAHLSLGLAPRPIDVIIQRLVRARIAGVAFSRDPLGRGGTVVEYVNGLGDKLVSGRVDGRRVTVSDDAIDPGDLPEVDRRDLVGVARLTEHVSRELGYDADVEWAADETTVWLLQARPITTVAEEVRAGTPTLDIADLYGCDADLAPFGLLPDFAAYFRAKRRRIWDFAGRHGLARGAALVVRANRLALNEPACVEELMRFCDGPEVIVDFSGNVRQWILPSGDLVEKLRVLMIDQERIHCFVVRAFIRGEAGLISQVAAVDPQAPEDPAILVEWTPEGLLALNRGTAATQFATLRASTALPDDRLPLDARTIATLKAATMAAQNEIGRIQIEWVVAGGRLYPVDFSPIAEQAAFKTDDAGSILSRGYADGPTLVVQATDMLTALSIAPAVSLTGIPEPEDLGPTFVALMDEIRRCSEPPIIVAPRPYAALAVLIPHVAGFVFERGPLLSHLAILLREQGLPAVQNPELFEAAAQAQRIALKALDTASVLPYFATTPS